MRIFRQHEHRKAFKMRKGIKADQAPLAWRSGASLKLPEPCNRGGYHVFLSHAWRHAQDTASLLNGRLFTLDVGCIPFLDVNDLDDLSKLELYIQRSDVVVIILTDAYLSSKNCRRELTEAVASGKKLVVLLESNPDKGATSATQLQAELESLDRSGELRSQERSAAKQLIEMLLEPDCVQADVPCVIEWHRELVFMRVAFKTIIANVLEVHATRAKMLQVGRASGRNPACAQVASLDELVFTNADDEDDAAKKTPERAARFVYLSPYYRELTLEVSSIEAAQGTHSNVFQYLSSTLADSGVVVVDRPPPSEGYGGNDAGIPEDFRAETRRGDEWPPWLLYLCPAVFRHVGLLAEIEEMLVRRYHHHDHHASQRMSTRTRSVSSRMRRHISQNFARRPAASTAEAARTSASGSGAVGSGHAAAPASSSSAIPSSSAMPTSKIIQMAAQVVERVSQPASNHHEAAAIGDLPNVISIYSTEIPFAYYMR